MKKILIMAAALCGLHASAQIHIIGITGGSSWANVAAVSFPADNGNRQGVTAGLTYEYRLKGHFSLGAALAYEQRGFISYLIFEDASGNPTGRKEPTSFNYNYLSLPLKAGFSTGRKIYGFANTGLVPALLVDARVKTPIFDQDANVIGSASYNVTRRVSRFDLAGMAEIGLGYRFRSSCAVYSSVAYQQSFTSITNSEYFPGSTARHYGTTVSAGLQYPLRRPIAKPMPASQKE